ncbi:PRSS37 isoform 4 [Pongo abelii]|uniref:PRSS37 isoform 4 n=1 Tax=Pongo abelii TaxID=9601 RepID=A0A2J8V352_PONAB|nr:PRSS37 isoform 4 [Pongo abelii]
MKYVFYLGVLAERRPCSLFGVPQVSLQPLCGRPHQTQLGAGPSSLLFTKSESDAGKFQEQSQRWY